MSKIHTTDHCLCLQVEGLDEYYRLRFGKDGLLDLTRRGAEQSVGATREAKMLSCLAYATHSNTVATKQSAEIAHKFKEKHWGENASSLKQAFRNYDFQRHTGEQARVACWLE